MPEIKPFSAIRYDAAQCGGDLSSCLAPPYDVLDRTEKYAMLSRNSYNIVVIDLPHIPPKTAGPAEVYDESARLLAEWLEKGVLTRDKHPALYLYHQCFEHARKPYTRRMFIARVRLEPFSAGSILPHERTFGGPKEDRLALMKATRCQLSPILGLYTDPLDEVGEAFAGVADRCPDTEGTLDGVRNLLWVVSDNTICTRVAAVLAQKRFYIADGHHRYGTALMYRDWLERETGGSLPKDHGANYVMFVLASMDDPGCLILPYNRALAGVDSSTVLDAWSCGVRAGSVDDADVVLVDGRTGNRAGLKFTNRDILKALAPEQCESWRRLDYAYLHRYLIDDLLRRKLGTEPRVRYLKSEEEAVESARAESGVALLLNATPMAQLREVSESGGLMPQKSTYFYPKLATGLTINPLE